MHEDSQEVLMEQANEIMELIEDVVQHYCDQERISGEKAWVMIHALATCKVSDFPDTPDLEDLIYRDEDNSEY